MEITPKRISALVLILLILIILLQNTQVVTVQVLFFSVRMSQILLILASLAIGFALGYGAHMYIGHRRKRSASG